jgi:hypothetical protein
MGSCPPVFAPAAGERNKADGGLPLAERQAGPLLGLNSEHRRHDKFQMGVGLSECFNDFAGSTAARENITGVLITLR